MGDGLRTDNLVIPQGETFARQYPVTGVSLAGATARSQIRAFGGALLHSFTPVVDAAAGTVTVQATGAESLGWDWQVGLWDLYLDLADTSQIRVVGGSVTLSPAVTRP